MLEDVSSGVDVHAAAKVVGEHVVVEPAAEVLCARRAADWSGHVKGFCNSSLFMLWCSGGGSRVVRVESTCTYEPIKLLHVCIGVVYISLK